MITTTTNMLIKLPAFDSIKITKLNNSEIIDLDTPSFKYLNIQRAISISNPYVREIIRQAPLLRMHKYILVDVKVHHLKKSQRPALAHWHIDCNINPLSKGMPEFNHLFISNDNSATEFLSTEFVMNIDDPNQRIDFNKVLCNQAGTKIEAGKFYTYSRHPHRATPAVKNGSRLLIRITEIDKILAPIMNFKVTYTKENK